MPVVVGLIGKKRAGKDTIAERLVRDYGFVRVAFADALKGAALASNPIVRVDYVACQIRAVRLADMVACYGWEKAKELPEVRRYLQDLGVAMRQIDTHIWLRPVVYAIKEAAAPVVVTDVRFDNEAAMLRERGARLVRVERPSVDDGDGHESETALPGVAVDRVVSNTGTIEDLADHVDMIARLTGA